MSGTVGAGAPEISETDALWLLALGGRGEFIDRKWTLVAEGNGLRFWPAPVELPEIALENLLERGCVARTDYGAKLTLTVGGARFLSDMVARTHDLFRHEQRNGRALPTGTCSRSQRKKPR
jgi:hypothetical protein